MEIELQAVISSLQLALYIGFWLIVYKAGVSKSVLNALQNWDWNCSQLMAVFVEGSSLLSQFDVWFFYCEPCYEVELQMQVWIRYRYKYRDTIFF